MRRDYFKNSLGIYAYGFMLMAKGVTHAFYVKSEAEREQWVAKLAPSVISVELCDEFNFQSRPLGKGSQAIVYLCNRKQNREVNYALKCFRKRDLQANLYKVNEMLDEIEILRSIKHDSVIQLYGVYETDDHVSLLLPYLQGGALFQQIQKKSVL